ncbi:MAG: DNA-3-methyladenine glycosylase [Gammaproteobacteria bacterium]|nr:DNA-3-methyladenine glycosylase [Gammaproteobacteria bacterium]|tara:strand:- start:126 stop:662 length:537 start_codon:yes stop_codon:yes gene_type:complete
MSYYCEASKDHPFHGPYHDQEYGFPLKNDNQLFERLVLEINQAGLSWLTILKKKEAFNNAFHGFDIKKVAAYKVKDKQRLLNDASIIRNRLKIDAAIANANRILELQKESGSFHQWLQDHHPLDKEEWVKLFKKTFRFTGGEITGEFLMSTGYLPGAHHDRCPIYLKIAKLNPPWMQK